MTLALEIIGLRKKYANGVEALQGIDLSVEAGSFFGLLGPNGAGKSTTIAIASSLIQKTSGKVKIFGIDIDEDRDQAKTFLGLVPQEFNFNQFEKVSDILINQAGYYGLSRRRVMPKVDYYLHKLGLFKKRKTMARELSGGMKRRLMIARALVHEPKMLILDEPTAGVDIEIRRDMWHFLQEINTQGVTVILTTHYLEEAEHLCRYLAIINHGQIIANTSVKELLVKLDKEQVILDLKNPVETIPEISPIRLKKIDDMTLEVTFNKNLAINELFAQLSRQGIEVMSMRNKSNRLEELFLQLVGNKPHDQL
jgi:ABC-2 type transport system ATP-binding protein